MGILLPEWSPQWGVMLTWPHAATSWAGWLPDVERVYGEMAREITARENLLVVAQGTAHEEHIRECIEEYRGDVSKVRFARAPCDDTWARDHGPLTVGAGGRLTLKDFTFNGWGNKWASENDNRISREIADAFKVTLESVDFVLEGGALESDGIDTLLTTSQCLLSPERNPQYDRSGIENVLRRELGFKRVLWLEHGHLEGDDTDSHIDTLARFASPSRIVYQACDDETDAHYADLKAMENELKALRQVNGELYELSALPWPGAQHDPVTQRRLPASYANYLIINDAVLAPSYADPADDRARAVLAAAHPGREIVMIDCRPIIRGFGSLHCLTMQLPEGTMQ